MENRCLSIEYNINGIGVVTPIVYPFVSSLYSDNKLRIEGRLKGVNQLGAIRFIHNGAHYTRYEYVLLQFMLINFIKNNSEWGLGSKFNFSVLGIDKLNYNVKNITGGEILELIVLFGNIGHFKDTFSSNKVWFHFLYTNKHNLKNCLKKGIKKDGKSLLDRLLSNSDYNKMQWINTLFILSRSKKLNDYRLICERILKKILLKQNDKWLDIYSKVRKVSFVVLDSHFSHIPISISLQNVLFNENLFIDELSKNTSGLMGAFDRITDLLEDTLYLENNASLMSTYRSMNIYSKVNKFLEENTNIKAIAKINMLITDEKKSPFYEEYKISENDIPWDRNKNLSITYFINQRDYFPIDVFQKELEISRKLGKNCYISYNFSPSFSKYRTVYSINKQLTDIRLIKECNKIIRVALDDYLQYHKYSNNTVNNGPLEEVVLKKVITYLFRNLLTKDFFCEFNYPRNASPFIIENGSKNTLNKLNDYIKSFQKRNPDDKDGLHELKTVKACLESISYRGLIIIFLGSLRFINDDKLSECELDGLILTPKHKDICVRVLEAKNLSKKKRRAKVATGQLENKFIPLLRECISDKSEIKEIEGFGGEVIIKN
ncbi:hypothetical protein HNQ94_001214 [Salirhabdus euzebyi]|uniref:Uncharacterized protein n=1 Tax=Salirhabdus euzebyi TaxID=394506 RepID=A0A841Q369_9BACI|nr:hypothetical protein [Salirhabdus euzebyi]MBB6452768.1 hypothetical protein [Salirhabdus euzebyi]